MFKKNREKKLGSPIISLTSFERLKGAFVHEHDVKFFNYFRMSVQSFDELLSKLENSLRRLNCVKSVNITS